MIRIVATPIIARDLAPGDLFSTVAQSSWNDFGVEGVDAYFSRPLYIRTGANFSRVFNPDAQVFKITIERSE